jgi:hypothetical protein
MKLSVQSLIVALGLGVSSLACNKDPVASGPVPAPTSAKAVAAGAGQHAAAGVTPGSHEDWCDEHQVPESQCTRCNPTLIAAFKATGDWCAEHGVPESQCTKCNPNLKIERPPKTEASK